MLRHQYLTRTNRRGPHSPNDGPHRFPSYGGYYELYKGERIREAACWAHARRKFFELADLRGAKGKLFRPLALEAMRRIDAVIAVERDINGVTAEQRLGGGEAIA